MKTFFTKLAKSDRIPNEWRKKYLVSLYKGKLGRLENETVRKINRVMVEGHRGDKVKSIWFYANFYSRTDGRIVQGSA